MRTKYFFFVAGSVFLMTSCDNSSSSGGYESKAFESTQSTDNNDSTKIHCEGVNFEETGEAYILDHVSNTSGQNVNSTDNSYQTEQQKTSNKNYDAGNAINNDRDPYENSYYNKPETKKEARKRRREERRNKKYNGKDPMDADNE